MHLVLARPLANRRRASCEFAPRRAPGRLRAAENLARVQARVESRALRRWSSHDSQSRSTSSISKLIREIASRPNFNRGIIESKYSSRNRWLTESFQDAELSFQTVSRCSNA